MCAKDDLVRRKGEPATAESVTAKDPNHVNTFSLDFAFSPLIARGNVSNANILSLIAFIISYRSFADELNIQQSLPDRATVVPIIISVNKTQLLLISGDVAAYTLLARFIPTTKIHNPLLKSQVYHYYIGKLLSQNAAKSKILLACADGQTRQCYLTICAILANYEEQVLLTSIKKNRYCTRCTRTEQFTQLQQERYLDKRHNDFIHPVNCFSTTLVTQESSSTQLNERFRQVMHSTSLKRFNNKRAFTEAIIQQLVAVVSPLFISKAPFALHFIRAVCNLVTLAQYKSYDEDTLAYIQGALERMNVFKEEFRHALTHIIQDIRMYEALDSICTRANSEAHHITIKEYILQICLHNSQRTALLAANHATVVKQSRPSTTSIPGIQPHSTKLPLSEVAANIAISDFTHAAAVRISVQIHSSIKCWRSSSKRHNDPKHCNEEVVRCAPNWQQTGLWRRDYVWVQEFKHRDNRRQSRTVTDGRVVAQLHLILTIIDHTRYDKDRKHMAYIRAFSKVLLFNNNRQIDNTTGILTFKFYDLSTIIRPVHLVLRDLPNSTTRTTMSYYVNNYIN
ncbi:hypothetical protein HBH46_180320 [Parastagonospora nodorum]|nr:hypothetical protein HBH46_180320 [Parastagonospora nodorum]